MIETYGYARAGFLGNPSDGYFGKTLAFAFSNFRARVLLYPSGRLEIKTSKADLPVWENLDDLYQTTRWRGYYGGIRIIQALIVRLFDYCRQQGIELPNRNFTLEYESTVPQRLGLGGVQAVLFSHDEGNELLAPVATDYCVLLFMSPYADLKIAMKELMITIDKLKKDIE